MEHKRGSHAARTVVGKAMAGASLMTGVQLVTRILTFLLNLVLTRTVRNYGVLGIANVQLYLVYTLTLGIVREGVRRTGLRVGSDFVDGKNGARHSGMAVEPALRDAAWVVVGCGIIVVPIVCSYFVWSTDIETLQGVPHQSYSQAVWLMGAAIIIELLSEPMFIVAQGKLEYEFRSYVEALALVARCFVQFLCISIFGLELAGFSWGFVAYSVVLLVAYLIHFQDNLLEVLPTTLSETFRGFYQRSESRQAELARLAGSMSLQQVWKLVLQEGEKMVMVSLGMGAFDQAVYSLVFNLGSLVVRFLFLPIEEAAFTIYGKLHDIDTRVQILSDTDKSSTLSPEVLVSVACKCMSIFGLIFCTFGPSYSHLLLHLLYGYRWSNLTDAPKVLSAYCFYIVFVAINGSTEAFVHAIGNEKTIRRFNWWLLLFSVSHLCASVLLFDQGALGLIFASCLSMGMRIVFSLNYICRKTSETNQVKLGMLFPRFLTLLCFLVSTFTVAWSERRFYDGFTSWTGMILHVAVGSICLACTIACIVLGTETEVVDKLSRLFKEVYGEKQSKKEE